MFISSKAVQLLKHHDNPTLPDFNFEATIVVWQQAENPLDALFGAHILLERR
jgi:hypothetical protein